MINEEFIITQSHAASHFDETEVRAPDGSPAKAMSHEVHSAPSTCFACPCVFYASFIPFLFVFLFYFFFFTFLFFSASVKSRLNFGKLYQLRDGTRGLQLRKYDDGRDVPGTTRYHRYCHYDEAGRF